MRPTDKIIAREAIINRNNLVDIAVLREVSMSRSGVGKRLKNYIIPELERVAAE